MEESSLFFFLLPTLRLSRERVLRFEKSDLLEVVDFTSNCSSNLLKSSAGRVLKWLELPKSPTRRGAGLTLRALWGHSSLCSLSHVPLLSEPGKPMICTSFEGAPLCVDDLFDLEDLVLGAENNASIGDNTSHGEIHKAEERRSLLLPFWLFEPFRFHPFPLILDIPNA